MTDIPLMREEQDRALRKLRAIKRFVDAYLATESQMEREVALLESEKENEDLCSFYEDELTELYSSCGNDTCGDGLPFVPTQARHDNRSGSGYLRA